jgi:hypothetical protein
MADVYSLSVRADTSDIRRGRKDLDRFGNQAVSTRSTVTKLGKSLVTFTAAATATSVALGAMAVSSIKAAKEVVGLARVANSTVPEFQKMAFGAKSVGVETGQLSDILKDMSDRVGDFLTTGGGPMADFFEKIAPQVGVTAEQFRKLSGPDALQLYVSSLEKANVSQNEMVFFMEAIASDASRLLPLMIDNGAAMALTAEQAEALGIALSEVDAQNITDASEQIDAVGSVFSALSEQLAAEVSPLVSALSRQFLDFTEDAGGVDEAVSDLSETVDVATDVAAALAIVVAGRLTSALAASGGALAFNAVQTLRLNIAFGRLVGSSAAATAGMLAMGAATKGASAAMALLGGPIGIVLTAAASLYYFRDALFGTGEGITELTEDTKGLVAELGEATQAQREFINAQFQQSIQEQKTAIAEAEDSIVSIGKRIESFTSGMGDAEKAFYDTSSVAKGFREDIKNAELSIDNAKSSIKAITKDQKEFWEEVDKTSGKIDDLTGSTDGLTGSTAAASAAIQLELTFLRAHNALIEAGVSATKAEVAIRETKRELQLESKGLTAAEAVKYVALEKAIRGALEAEAERASALESIRAQLNPAQAEFTRYADQLDMIDSFNISAGEKEALREESFRQHQERMNAIASEGQDIITEQKKQAEQERIAASRQANSMMGADFLTSAENISIAFKDITASQQSSVNALGGAMSNITSIMAQGGEESFQAYKRLAQAEAAIAGSLAFIKALASAPPPANFILAGSIAALTAVNIAAIDQQEYQGARAMGGSVTGGNSYMVGENGPEVVTMGGSGVVTPSSVNNNGGTTNVTQVFQLGGGGGDAKRQILAAAPFIKAQAKQAVLEAINQGGAMSRAVGRRG